VPYRTLPGGDIANDLVVKIVNRAPDLRRYRLAVEGAEGVRLVAPDPALTLAPGESGTAQVEILAPPGSFRMSRAAITVHVRDGVDLSISRSYRLQGPFAAPGPGQDHSP
jgi:polyferredoxin